MDTESFPIHIITEDFYVDIAIDVGKWFDILNYSKDDKSQLTIDKNKKKNFFFKDELGGKIMKEFVRYKAKTYAFLIDNDSENKKAKGTKKCVIKRRLMF